ncbi:hypothetical protein ACH5AJ_33475 [Streptomyces rochei]|uniref:Uncharacterized protein n=1 Tax=Streptomyces vinaceusdrappus TaxID=67376 RepID=A0ABY6C4Y0_9ACTN|nr:MULTISPECIES: hypothetical protein [Streptomyces]NUV96921.1 hypothetical protein [Streptomyces sp. KAI 90]RSS23531.1 hypothetical protein EF916_30170 [Streptomyces sp. WAC08452]UXI82837.1 hypothetical protein N6Q81_34670 [Streptomyces vinaceusdrappus]
MTEAQKQLICETLMFHADRPDGDRPSIVRLGVDRASAAQVMEKASGANSEFQLNEIHVLFAALVSAPVMMPSEEVFYERIGFFREQALALAGGLVSAVEEAPNWTGEPSGSA